MLKTVLKNKPAFSNQYFNQISEERNIDLIGITKAQFIHMFESPNPYEWFLSVDAKITKNISEDENKLEEFFKKEDLFLVDRF